MRALVVEDLAELVEPTLLRSLIGCRRIGGFLLEGQVHSLVATVLIRCYARSPAEPRRGEAEANRPAAKLPVADQ